MPLTMPIEQFPTLCRKGPTMSPQRYKTLLTFLPGMASVVNAFDSPQVQSAVYQMLMEALDTKLDAEGMGRALPTDQQTITPLPTNGELTHELIEGDSIHADHRKQVRATA